MLEIQNTLVSLDLVERFFCCDLASCLGQCCIDGDAGAPVTPDEVERLREVLPEIWNDLSPAAQRVIQEQGVAYREGRVGWRKPSSCALYPVRLKEYKDFTAVNLHRWKICKCAEVLGRREGIRAYEFLKGPLTERFGEDWYAELAATCEEYLRQYGD